MAQGAGRNDCIIKPCCINLVLLPNFSKFDVLTSALQAYTSHLVLDMIICPSHLALASCLLRRPLLVGRSTLPRDVFKVKPILSLHPQQPPWLGSHTLDYLTPALINPRQSHTTPIPQSLLKLLKLVNPKSVYPTSPVPSCRNTVNGIYQIVFSIIRLYMRGSFHSRWTFSDTNLDTF